MQDYSHNSDIMKEIYTQIGEIIVNSQYIEWNLALIIRYNSIITQYERKENIQYTDFADIEEQANALQNEMRTMTLGQITQIAESTKIFSISMLETLKYIWEKRNLIVHHYFKINDFHKHMQNPLFMSNRKKELSQIKFDMQNFNRTLAKIVFGLHQRYNSLV